MMNGTLDNTAFGHPDAPWLCITRRDGRLVVPDHPVIPFIEGDGIGKEISIHVQGIVDSAVDKAYGGKRKIGWKEVLAGEKAFNKVGSWLPDETIEAFRGCLVGIKGPLTTPVGEGIRSLNVALRQELDLYVCLRPVRWFKGVATPLLHPEKVHVTIFRENTEDIYAGIEWAAGTPELKRVLKFLQEEMGVGKIRFPESTSLGVKPVSVEGTERLVRAAIEYALGHGLPSVTLVHKGNIMKFTEGGFKKWGYALAEREFADQTFTENIFNKIKAEQGLEKAVEAYNHAIESGKVFVKDVIADAFLQNTLLKPEEYSVIATLNLNGDYISDQLAAMVGGIGIAPGANINYHTGHAIFEATHGTAPDIAGKDKANPCSMLLSAVMMLEYMGWKEAGDLITSALEVLFENGYGTSDLAQFMENGKPLSTSDFSGKVIENL
ncbi:NADP-dependent isocitrate dehydrogenase [Proteiniphilum sp. X52]|uniref:NADP-dependent isocitrate dehydrogenase n=1 Tax=Proteiniphilum sp. X52 TaxID=2382159 RepID=UPI000F0A1BB7|nr:NADP-dependent isocitrate dehydrogenase [Proteiniphilum sp. X52]RNC64087.1 NADP-dependent isocitrate dehydrogenase [Proteiniphilum sp. X52]